MCIYEIFISLCHTYLFTYVWSSLRQFEVRFKIQVLFTYCPFFSYEQRIERPRKWKLKLILIAWTSLLENHFIEVKMKARLFLFFYLCLIPGHFGVVHKSLFRSKGEYPSKWAKCNNSLWRLPWLKVSMVRIQNFRSAFGGGMDYSDESYEDTETILDSLSVLLKLWRPSPCSPKLSEPLLGAFGFCTLQVCLS